MVMSENKKSSVGHVTMNKMWESFKKPRGNLANNEKLSKEDEKKRSARLALLLKKGYRKDDPFRLPNGFCDVIVSVKPDGMLVLKYAGDYDPLES